jgi:hypothetical protein
MLLRFGTLLAVIALAGCATGSSSAVPGGASSSLASLSKSFTTSSILYFKPSSVVLKGGGSTKTVKLIIGTKQFGPYVNEYNTCQGLVVSHYTGPKTTKTGYVYELTVEAGNVLGQCPYEVYLEDDPYPSAPTATLNITVKK